ncbi:SDR family oxidoreductase [Tautonia plasticadhaerens]|uniref:NAD dependent epimerase/dehydratase family protein n=1 Tax=Tautonia plasticadhaerens TaxID=2527974 RepID=A0A518H787_9BACT|nr:SDR family oxidoreductase [Tautonia plasticadhaerens]QDV36703.1 NAD dependent epimerase/dehydratase family protein [Tautonia plasticadhaerens]
MSTLIIGCGYLGVRVARRLREDGHRVFGTTRSRARAEALAAEGIEPILADVLDRDSLSGLPSVDRAFYCVGYDRGSGVPIGHVYVDGLRHALGRLANRARRLVYASSTGVYGDHGGGWIDEEAAPDPGTESGRACLQAEAALREFSQEYTYPASILRFSGLYGPGRVMRRDAILAGEPIPSDPEAYLNLVHVDDAASAAVAALRVAKPGPLYLVSDDRPVTRAEFYAELATLLGGPEPRFTTPPGRGPVRGDSNKRVSNRRMKRELGLTLAYPDVSTGLPAALAAERRERDGPSGA